MTYFTSELSKFLEIRRSESRGKEKRRHAPTQFVSEPRQNSELADKEAYLGYRCARRDRSHIYVSTRKDRLHVYAQQDERDVCVHKSL